MNIISIQYLLFVITTSFIYWIFFDNNKNHILLFACLLFLLFQGIEEFLITFIYLLFGYFFSKHIYSIKTLWIYIVISVLPLIFNKYLPFTNIPIIGLSYLTFKMVSYLVNTYNKKINNTNYVEYFIYMLFFPSLLSGPIEEPTAFIKQINEKKEQNWKNVLYGIFISSYGVLIKIIASERLLQSVTYVLNNSDTFMSHTIIGLFMYSLYIYIDFSSYSSIAYGTALIFGYKITNNFKQPYFSKSFKEFWNRWHVSLNQWLTRYIYIPLGGNKKGKIRKYINIIIVFTVSGLWHGNSANYIVWGIMNGLIFVFEGILFDVFIKSINNSIIINIIRRAFTFIVISFTWVFFYSENIMESIKILKNIFIYNNESILSVFSEMINSGSITMIGLILTLLITILITIIDINMYNNIDLINKIIKSNIIVRYAILLMVLFLIIIFGYYGEGFELSKFIYSGY